MEFDKAQNAFYAKQNNKTAAEYLLAANALFITETDDETLVAVVDEISRWLLGKPLLGDTKTQFSRASHYSE